MDLADLINSRRFLGSEFLMWLWFKSECFDGLFEIKNHGEVEVVFDDRLTLEAYLAETESNVFKGGTPAFSPEAKTALREGKRPTRARLRILKEGREWKFKYKADGMDLSTLNVPSLLSKRDDEQFYERMALIEEVESILDELYHEFLKLRLSGAWPEDLVPAMVDWIDTDEAVDPDAYPEDMLRKAAAGEYEKTPKGVAINEIRESEGSDDGDEEAPADEDTEEVTEEPTAEPVGE